MLGMGPPLTSAVAIFAEWQSTRTHCDRYGHEALPSPVLSRMVRGRSDSGTGGPRVDRPFWENATHNRELQDAKRLFGTKQSEIFGRAMLPTSAHALPRRYVVAGRIRAGRSSPM